MTESTSLIKLGENETPYAILDRGSCVRVLGARFDLFGTLKEHVHFEKAYLRTLDGKLQFCRERTFGVFPDGCTDVFLDYLSLRLYRLIPGVQQRVKEQEEFTRLYKEAEKDGAQIISRAF
jgi:hypothetical protein